MARDDKDKPPKGGWLGPPPAHKLAPIATARGAKKGKWIWKENKLTDKQKLRHEKFQRKMKKADKAGEWRF